MFKYTINFFIDSKKEINSLKKIWFPLAVYQSFIRILLVILFSISYSYLSSWVLINPGDEKVFVTGFDTLNQIHLDRLIIAFILAGLLFLIHFLTEFLGVISISRQYHLGKRVSLRKTIFEIIKFYRMNLKVQILKYLFILFNIVFGIVSIYIFLSFFPNYFGIILSILLFIFSAYIIVDKAINYNYVGQKVFENKNNIFEIYNYKISKERKIKLFKFYIFKILLLLFIILVFPTLWLTISWFITNISIEHTIISSVLLGINTLVLVICGTIFSYLFVSFFSLRATRLYLEFTGEINTNTKKYTEKNILKFKKTFFISIILIISIIVSYISFGYFYYFNNHIIKDKEITVFAHRATMMNETNNSIEALNYSIENKIQYVEIDVQLSKEGIPVVFHDYTYFDGKQTKYIHNTPLKELKLFNLREEKNSENNKEEIPTLEEFLIESKGKIKVNIEIKTIKNFEEELATKVAQVVNNLNIKNEVIITSFDHNILAKVKELIPGIETGLIITAYIGEIEEINDFDVDWLMVNNIYYDLYKEIFRTFDKKIALWSFEEIDGDIVLYEEINGIIVDDPVSLNKEIQEYKALPKGEKLYRHIEYFFFSEDNFSIINK